MRFRAGVSPSYFFRVRVCLKCSMNAIQIAEICATDMHAPHKTASKHDEIKKKCAHFTDKINKID